VVIQGVEMVETENKKRLYAVMISLIAVCMSLFHIYYNTLGFITNLKLCAFHLMFAMVLIFLTFPSSRKKRADGGLKRPNVLDIILALLAIAVGLYIIFEENSLVFRYGNPNSWDVLFGSVAVILTLEITRRTIGLPLVITATMFLGYAFFGQYIKGPLSHRGYGIERVISSLYLFTDGIYGTPLAVVATVVIFFIIFGAFLEKSGGGEFFITLAYSLTGRMKGGPAKTAVIASGLMGTISGSAVANVVTTGTFTIPMMKKIGYKAAVAGAIEAAASSGGYIMPPVMGAAAFILCEFTGRAYIDIVKVAIAPALIYYIAVYAFVHFEAAKHNILGVERKELPDFWKTLLSGSHFLLAFLVLLYLLVKQYSPALAAIAGFSSVAAASMLRRGTRMSIRDILGALELGARNCVTVSAACACAGIIIAVINLTGLGLTFSSLLLSIASGQLFIGVCLTLLAGTLLSMSLTVTADYIILAILAAPALVSLGLDLLTAHFIALWCAVLSNVTPPLALAAYAASGIAKSDPMRTALYAARVAKVFFAMPFVLAFYPIITGNPMEIIYTTTVISISFICFTASFVGYFIKICSQFERVTLSAAGGLFLWPGLIFDLVAGLLVISIIIKQLYALRLSKRDSTKLIMPTRE
jgi:TRAP transporter 4TM/12TM fusion protein